MNFFDNDGQELARHSAGLRRKPGTISNEIASTWAREGRDPAAGGNLWGGKDAPP